MNPDSIHGQLRVEFEKMEKARKLLASRAGKYHGSPYIILLVVGLLLLMSLNSGSKSSLEETMVIIFLAAAIGALNSELRTANKRIDKIVELTAVEKILEEKYGSYMRFIAEFSKLASPDINNKPGSSTD